MEIIMNEINDSYIEDVVSFHNINYGAKRTSQQWIWEYKSNYPNLFVFTIMKDDNKIIGTQGMIPIYLNINDKKILSGKSENSLLDTNYRGKKLFEKLYEYAMSLCKDKNMCCVWGFTSAFKVWRDKLHFTIYEDIICNTLLILNLRRFIFSQILKSKQSKLKKCVKSFLAMILYVYSYMRNFFYSKIVIMMSKPSNFIIYNKLININDINELYIRFKNKYPDLIYIEQDENYITWRIFNNPNVKYLTYFLYEDNLLKAYCYISLDTLRDSAMLTDFTFENEEVGRFLLKSILNDLRKSNISVVSFIGNIKNTLICDTFKLLKKYGFYKRMRLSPFVLRNISYNDEEYLFDIKKWYINALWTEGYEY